MEIYRRILTLTLKYAFSGRTEDDDEKRREYEGIEIERDDQLISIEEEAFSAKHQAHEHTHILMETQRKLQVVEGDFDKACQRCDAAVAKEQSYLDLIERNGEELRSLEDRDNEAAEREIEAEEKLRLVYCGNLSLCLGGRGGGGSND